MGKTKTRKVLRTLTAHAIPNAHKHGPAINTSSVNTVALNAKAAKTNILNTDMKVSTQSHVVEQTHSVVPPPKNKHQQQNQTTAAVVHRRNGDGRGPAVREVVECVTEDDEYEYDELDSRTSDGFMTSTMMSGF